MELHKELIQIQPESRLTRQGPLGALIVDDLPSSPACSSYPTSGCGSSCNNRPLLLCILFYLLGVADNLHFVHPSCCF
jgi:hypothetical protein